MNDSAGFENPAAVATPGANGKRAHADTPLRGVAVDFRPQPIGGAVCFDTLRLLGHH